MLIIVHYKRKVILLWNASLNPFNTFLKFVISLGVLHPIFRVQYRANELFDCESSPSIASAMNFLFINRSTFILSPQNPHLYLPKASCSCDT